MTAINITLTCQNADKVAATLISGARQIVEPGKHSPIIEELKSPEGRRAIIEILSKEMNKHGKKLF